MPISRAFGRGESPASSWSFVGSHLVSRKSRTRTSHSDSTIARGEQSSSLRQPTTRKSARLRNSRFSASRKRRCRSRRKTRIGELLSLIRVEREKLFVPQQSTHLVADSFTWVTTKGTKTLSFSESLLFAGRAEAATTVTVTLIDCVSYILPFDHNARPLQESCSQLSVDPLMLLPTLVCPVG